MFHIWMIRLSHLGSQLGKMGVGPIRRDVMPEEQVACLVVATHAIKVIRVTFGIVNLAAISAVRGSIGEGSHVFGADAARSARSASAFWAISFSESNTLMSSWTNATRWG